MTRTDGKWDGRWIAIAVFVFAGFVGLQGNGLASFLLAGIAVYMFSSIESSMREADAEQAKTERQREAYRAAQKRAEQERALRTHDRPMDEQTQQERETARSREAYRNAASNLLAFGHEADEPAQHRVQSPTSGAWHPCHCSRRRDHVGTIAGMTAQTPGLSLLDRIRAQRPDFVVPPPTTAPEPPVRRSISARPEPKAIRTGDGFVTVIATGERVYYPGCAAHGVHCHPEGEHTDFCQWAFEMDLLDDDDDFTGRLA